MASKMNRFCVIGPNCGRYSSEYERKWFDSEADAAKHADSLLQGREPGSSPAFVVEVKRVVEVRPHPIVHRAPQSRDFPC